MSVLLVLVDGLGAGDGDPAVNPLAAEPGLLAHFTDGTPPGPLPEGARVQLVDATLGVEGRPQSATGHSAILTGVNAAAHLGGHRLGFPGKKLIALLEQDNLFKRAVAAGHRVAVLNAYPRFWLEALGARAVSPRTLPEPEVHVPARLARPPASTVAARAAGLAFHTFEDVLEGHALPHSLTGAGAARWGLPPEPLTPEEAGRRLAAAARRFDLSFFEYFLTDKAGHARDHAAARARVSEVQRALAACAGALGPADTLFVISDHGNVEDLSIRTHTLRPVPFLGAGRAAGAVDGARDLTDVAGRVASALA